MTSSPSRGPVVPYIAAWSTERPTRQPLVARGSGIGYTDEHPYDRDAHGVLWMRAPSSRGRGRPEFGKVHPLRQRRAMRGLLCQVCGEAADRNEQGVLWLLRDERGSEPGWPEGVGATHPPVCVPCAVKSTQLCPHLRGRFLAVRVRESAVCGVYGVRYRPGRFGVEPEPEGVIVEYGDAAARWAWASQLVRELRGCSSVDLAVGGGGRGGMNPGGGAVG